MTCSPEGYARCCEAIAAWQFEDADKISAPTLMLAGADDNALPAALTEAVAAAIPNSHLETVAGAGHLLTVEKPDQATTRAKAHLQR
jgi:pimeloyl-ACP methyl ester carboxylesterase